MNLSTANHDHTEADLSLTRKILDLLVEKGVISDYNVEVEDNVYVIGVQPAKKAQFLFVEHTAPQIVYVDVGKMTTQEAESVIKMMKDEMKAREQRTTLPNAAEFERVLKSLSKLDKETVNKLIKGKPVA